MESVRQLVVSLLVVSTLATSSLCSSSSVYHNEFAVHVPHGSAAADAIAARHGLVNMGQIGSLENFYLFENGRLSKRSASIHAVTLESLMSEQEIDWVEQLKEKKRVKRDLVVFPEVKRSPLRSSFFLPVVGKSSRVFGGNGKRRVFHSGTRHSLNAIPGHSDPMFSKQWHLNAGAEGGFDMNVKPAWAKGITGKNVVVTILDDGIQTNHPDLIQNYDPRASIDINGNDPDPMPQDNGDNKHGTRCAGEVAATAFNGFCGVGVAYNASIGGVRMLDGVVNDAVEARALSLNPDHIDIYSASWGPEDDGKTVDGPGPLAKRAFLNGVIRGRGGRGSIFVWASGNGGRHRDNCNCDGYTNSIFTLSISSATQTGNRPWYLEECSSTLATTYSSGTPGLDSSIATVDQDARLRPDHLCTASHTGTSASAPLAAAVCALALEANPALTWRDMQHLVVSTSRPEPLLHENGWRLNGAGKKYSHKFGFGLMDAARLVEAAQIWPGLPHQHICQTGLILSNLPISPETGNRALATLNTDGCTETLNAVKYLEHVQCKVTLRFRPRGHLSIILTSPSGTRSTLLLPRPKDTEEAVFDAWPFMSVHFWGENPKGQWTIEVVNSGQQGHSGILKRWQLVLYGTNEHPGSRRRVGRSVVTPFNSLLAMPLREHARRMPRDNHQDQRLTLQDVYLEHSATQ